MTGNLQPTSPLQGWPVPTDLVDPDIPDDIMKLAKAIEKRVIGVYATAAIRDSATTGQGLEEGMFAYVLNDETNPVSYFNGTSWIPFPPKPPQILNGASVPSNAIGNNGDVFFQV